MDRSADQRAEAVAGDAAQVGGVQVGEEVAGGERLEQERAVRQQRYELLEVAGRRDGRAALGLPSHLRRRLAGELAAEPTAGLVAEVELRRRRLQQTRREAAGGRRRLLLRGLAGLVLQVTLVTDAVQAAGVHCWPSMRCAAVQVRGRRRRWCW